VDSRGDFHLRLRRYQSAKKLIDYTHTPLTVWLGTPGNANLPIGGLKGGKNANGANREIGAPGIILRVGH